MFMLRKTALLCFGALAFVAEGSAQEGPVPKGVPKLDHVFVIMMENHGYSQIVGNPQAPFANKLAKAGNTAKNYFPLAHPSLTNYLEVAVGSQFGGRSGTTPAWHHPSCLPTLRTRLPKTGKPPPPHLSP